MASSGSTPPTSAAGGGILVDDSAFTPRWIDTELMPLLADGGRLQRMAEAAASVGERGADENSPTSCPGLHGVRSGWPVNGQNSRFDFREPVPTLDDLGAVHFIAIGGAGMSGVARVTRARLPGQRLRRGTPRSSAPSPPRARPLHVGHDPAHLDGTDTVVISSAVRE